MTKLYWIHFLNEDDNKWKMTSKYWMWNISATTGLYSNFKLKLKWLQNSLQILKMKMTFMEDDLKISKVEYLSNNLLDPSKNVNLILDDQTILYKSFKWWWHPMEVDLKILQVEYLSNCLLDYTQILSLHLDDQTILYKSFKWRRPTMEDDLKILKV